MNPPGIAYASRIRRVSLHRCGSVLAILSLLVTVACGSRLSNSKLEDAIRGPVGATATTLLPTAETPGQATSPGALPAGNAGPGAAVPGTPSQSTATGSATGSAAPGAVATPGAAATPSGSQTCTTELSTINIGTVGEFSGVFGPDFGPGPQGVQAWVASVNAQGGINCHPVKYFVMDDGGDPSVNESEVETLVQQDHIVAIVQEGAPLGGAASVGYLTQHQIPVIGDEGGSDYFYSSPTYFPQETSGVSVFPILVGAIAAYGHLKGLTKLATISCIEAAICSTLYTDAPQLAQQTGLQLVYRGQASLTTPDFTSNCEAAQKAGAQLFLLGEDTNSIERLLANCKSIGYQPVFSTGGVLAAPSLLQDPLSNGMVIASATVPDIYTSNPQVEALDAALARYSPGLVASDSIMSGWLSAQLFAMATAHVTGAPTSQDVLNGMYTIKDNDLDGATSPLTFTRGQDAARVICYWDEQIHNGGFAIVGNGNRICQQ